MSVLETKTETDTSDYATSLGCLTLKLLIWGRKGWPDRIYIYKGAIIFVEFKREKKDPRKLQGYVHEKLREHGIKVYVVDNFEDGKELIHRLVYHPERL